MTHFDVFNGDADGLCALHQLRLAAPKNAVLISGAKRNIELLQRVDAQAGDSVTALDISVARNRPALIALLERGVSVEYFDHHYAGELPVHPNLRAVIDTSPHACTAILVDRHLAGRYRVWAVVAAYGDNLISEACTLAAPLRLSAAELTRLHELGATLTYNGYGDSETDLIVHPAFLYRMLHRFADPFEFMRLEPLFRTISDNRSSDLDLARTQDAERRLAGATIHILPDAPWSRRVRGVVANEWATRAPGLAQAVLTHNGRGGYAVSVRAPLARPAGADALCRKFATGGGRVAAAGIDHLPEDQVPEFVRQLDQAFP